MGSLTLHAEVLLYTVNLPARGDGSGPASTSKAVRREVTSRRSAGSAVRRALSGTTVERVTSLMCRRSVPETAPLLLIFYRKSATRLL
ncbi:hypothetical protein EVAR_22747_1 [Eumeta japonica]|uniref:Uncharacterized protein n=1 Tax=Eumeta variegata TaxID=151549 RepID=A0A4C1USE8_EUMVA|nr:hypothetical protein EVAR_22747_1 [Eumeta japonica]